jgi:hypothetical protein
MSKVTQYQEFCEVTADGEAVSIRFFDRVTAELKEDLRNNGFYFNCNERTWKGKGTQKVEKLIINHWR